MGISVTIRGTGSIRRRLDTMRQRLGAGGDVVNAGVWNEGQKTKSGTPVPEYAYYNNYGTPKIPERPFITFAWLEERPQLLFYVRNALATDGSLYSGLVAIGQNLAAQIRRQILANIPPPNTPATLARKAPGLPTLIDTRTMLNSVKYTINGAEQ